MISDENKGIVSIKYNHLNLPVEITFVNGKINYLYNASGVKLGKTVYQAGQNPVVTDYLGGFQYVKNELQFFPHPEGYVSVVKFGPETLVINYAYQYKDHLGNIRLNYGKDPETNVLKVLEENHYYPFGLKHQNYNTGRRQLGKKEEILAGNLTLMPAFVLPTEDKPMVYKYRYNSKEFQDELNLNVYDYGAMMYDPAIGRRNNIDPLAEMSRRWSPYSYAYNSPLRFIDPDGMLAQSVIDDLWNKSGSGETKWTNNNGTFTNGNGDTVDATEENDDGGGDDKGKKLSGGQYNGKNSGDITNKRDFNGFTLDVREVTDLSHEEAFDLFENVFKERQTMFDDMMEWIDKSGYILAADVKTLLEELKKGNPLRLSAAAMMEYAKWKTSKVSSQNEGVFKAYIGLHVKDPSQMKGIIQIYERFGVSIYEDVTVHYYDRSTGKYLGKVD